MSRHCLFAPEFLATSGKDSLRHASVERLWIQRPSHAVAEEGRFTPLTAALCLA